MSAIEIKGRCLCGAIAYVATVPPTRSMVCHCHSCRRAHSAPFVPWVTFPSSALRFVRGRPTEFRSTPPVVRTFCATCGAPLTYQHDARKAEIDVATCTLDDPDRFPPTHHSWTSHDLTWGPDMPGLPRFERFKPSEEG